MATTAPSGNTSLPGGVPQPPETTIPPNGTAAPGVQLGDPAEGVVSADNGFGDIDSIEATPVFWPVPLRDYNRVSATNSMGGIPRFGHSSDFSNVAYIGSATNSSAGQDYIVGLIFAGCFLLMFFLTWSIVLVVFKISLTGFLSGEPFVNPHISDPIALKEKEEMEIDGEEYTEDTNWLKRPRRIRIVFFICGLLQIIFAILLVTKGVNNIQQTTDTIQISTHSLRLIVNEVEKVTKDLEQVAETSTILRDQIVFDLNKDNFCPANPVYAETQAGQSIMGAAAGAIKVLNNMGDFVTQNVAILEESMASVKRNIDRVDVSVENVENSDEWLGGLVAFPFLILSSLMMVGAVAAQLNTMSDCFLCVLNWVLLPLYIFLTVMTYVSLGLIAIAASSNADFCGGGTSTPDQVIVDLMVRSGFKQDDLFFQTVRYYAYQCTARAETDPYLFLRTFSGLIVQGEEVLQNVTDNMDKISLEQLSLGCNRDFQPLHRALGQMIGVLDALSQSANSVLNLLGCQQVVPIYTEVSYDALCTYSVSGLAWMFSCLLILSVTGHIVIMFRSSYQNTVFDSKHVMLDESSGLAFRSRTAEQNKTAKGDDERWNDEDEGR